jgi:hypothetical protein
MRKGMTQTLKEMLDKSGIQKSAVYELRNKYYTLEPTPRSIRQVYIGFCTGLITKMTANGATADELEKAMLFSYVVLDADKYRLNILTAKDDLGIQALHEKYK